MSCKKKTACSDFEHHEGMPPSLGDNQEKVPQENGDIVLTNVVCTGKGFVCIDGNMVPKLMTFHFLHKKCATKILHFS